MCATGACLLAVSASFEVCPSSGSVDVEVFVRYNAVGKYTAGASQRPEALQFQTPRPGKRSWIKCPSSPQVTSVVGIKVQPLGSSSVSTPLVCTPSGSKGWDGKTATAPVGATEHVGVPLTVVESVPVHVMFGA